MTPRSAVAPRGCRRRRASVYGDRELVGRTVATGGRRGWLGVDAGAAARLAAGQTELDLGLCDGVGAGTLPITSSRMSHLCDALTTAYRALGFERITEGDNIFRDLVVARIIEPTSKVSNPLVPRRLDLRPPLAAASACAAIPTAPNTSAP
jgi:hypothetical protein